MGKIKCSMQLAEIVKILQAKLQDREINTRLMIQFGKLDVAENNLPVIDLLCKVLGCLGTVEGTKYAALTSSLREKRSMIF
jgi:hypothetical protein